MRRLWTAYPEKPCISQASTKSPSPSDVQLWFQQQAQMPCARCASLLIDELHHVFWVALACGGTGRECIFDAAQIVRGQANSYRRGIVFQIFPALRARDGNHIV